MPKRKRGKDSEYLRFRPYRAFTTEPVQQNPEGWSIVWRVIFVVAAVALVFFAALSLGQH